MIGIFPVHGQYNRIEITSVIIHILYNATDIVSVFGYGERLEGQSVVEQWRKLKSTYTYYYYNYVGFHIIIIFKRLHM